MICGKLRWCTGGGRRREAGVRRADEPQEGGAQGRQGEQARNEGSDILVQLSLVIGDACMHQAATESTEPADGEKQAFAGLTGPKRAGPSGDKVSRLSGVSCQCLTLEYVSMGLARIGLLSRR